MKDLFSNLDMRDAISFVSITSFMSLAFMLAIWSPESDIFKMLLGGLLTVGYGNIIGYYYNSSKGSAMKDEVLAKTMEAQGATIDKQSIALAASVPAPVEPDKK